MLNRRSNNLNRKKMKPKHWTRMMKKYEKKKKN